MTQADEGTKTIASSSKVVAMAQDGAVWHNSNVCYDSITIM